MPVLHQLQPAFNNGEISPLLYDRVDFQKFVSSVKSGKNMFVHPQGGMSNRAGTVMLAAAKDEKVRLIPFEFSSTETYVIEFGNGYCRFFTSNGQVVVEEGGVQVPYEIESPFTTADLDKIRYCQSGDVMYIAWGKNPKCLIRKGHTNWIFSDYDYKNGPFQIQNIDENKHLAVSYDVAESAFCLTSDFDAFNASSVGQLVSYRYTFGATHFSGSVNSASGDYESGNSLASGTYEFHTTGTWTGTIKIEYSKDLVNWKSEREFSGASNINFDYSGVFEEGIFWIRISAKITNGTLTYTFDSQSFNDNLFFKITSFSSSRIVYAESVNDIVGLDSIFTGEGDIIEVIPNMTSNTTPSGTAYSTNFGNNAYLIFNRTDFEVPLYAGNSYSFGYQPQQACFVDKVTLGVLCFDGYITTQGTIYFPNSIDKIFSSFKIYYSLSGGTRIQVPYSVSIENTNYSVGYFVFSFSQPVLCDNLFFEATVTSGSNSDVYAYIGKTQASGFAYTPGGGSLPNLNNDFSFGLWSDATYWPSEVDLYQDRIVWATNNQIDATKISDYKNFSVSNDVTDDDAISVIVKDKKVDKINSIVAGQKLAVYSDDGNFVHNNDTFTPNSATFLKQGATGGSDVKPVVVRDHIIYAHPMKQAISDYAYNFETDGYAGQDITLLANHLFDGKVIKTLAYQQEPYSIIWVLQEEGTVLACTYLRQQNVIAWTPMDFGGVVQSIAVCSYGTKEELYLSVKRATGTFVEKMPIRLLSTDPKECFFVDCGRTYRGDPATTISGLGYLEGQHVVALADGNVIKDLTVENGSITLPIPASVVTVGLPYESVLETLTFDANTGDGSNLNRKKRVVAVSIRYNASRGSKLSVNGHTEVDMLRREQEGYNIPIALKSGIYREIVASTHNERTTIKIRQDEPLPITVVSIIPEIEYER